MHDLRKTPMRERNPGFRLQPVGQVVEIATDASTGLSSKDLTVEGDAQGLSAVQGEVR